jgi:hypothetical protein
VTWKSCDYLHYPKVRRYKIHLIYILGIVKFSAPMNLSLWIMILNFPSTSFAPQYLHYPWIQANSTILLISRNWLNDIYIKIGFITYSLPVSHNISRIKNSRYGWLIFDRLLHHSFPFYKSCQLYLSLSLSKDWNGALCVTVSLSSIN